MKLTTNWCKRGWINNCSSWQTVRMFLGRESSTCQASTVLSSCQMHCNMAISPFQMRHDHKPSYLTLLCITRFQVECISMMAVLRSDIQRHWILLVYDMARGCRCRELVVHALRRLPLAVSSPKLAQRACLLYGKRSCGFADSSTSGTVARTTCTRGAAPDV